MPKLGILFDIDELGGGLYGYAAYQIFFDTLDTHQLAGCTLYDGDTNATLYGSVRQYCIAIDSVDAAKIALVRNALGASQAQGLLPLPIRFLEHDLVSREPLVQAGQIIGTGELVGDETSWMTAAWKKSQEKHEGSSSTASAPAVLSVAGAVTQSPAHETGRGTESSVKSEQSKPLTLTRSQKIGNSVIAATLVLIAIVVFVSFGFNFYTLIFSLIVIFLDVRLIISTIKAQTIIGTREAAGEQLRNPPTKPAEQDNPQAQIPTSSPVNVTIDGTSFLLVTSVAALCAAIEAGGKGVLRFPSLTYGEMLRDLAQKLEKRYGQNCPQYRDTVPSPLVCAACLWELPGSYKLSLQGAFRSMRLVTGATPGFDQFGKSGICPQCGSDESLLVYEYFPREQVSMSDVHAIRRYWQQQARTWWQNRHQGYYENAAFCDACGTVIAQHQGYLEGPSSLICEECVTKDLMTKGLEKLKDDPHYYGEALLRKVRHFST